MKQFLFIKNAFKDCVFILIISLISVVLYVRNIGFYSDDWPLLASFKLSNNETLLGLVKTATNTNTLMRPVQNVLDAILFLNFGTHPIGYQLISVSFLLVNAILFYALLRALKVSRSICVIIPILFTLLPNYLTDRFWLAAFQANLSNLFYFISSLAAIYAFHSENLKSKIASTLSILFLTLSALSYEVIMPLYFLNAFSIGLPSIKKALNQKSDVKIKGKNILLMASIIMTTVLIFIFKAKATTRLENGPFQSLILYPAYVVYIVTFSFWTNYLQIAANLVLIWKDLVASDISSGILPMAVLIGICIFFYLYYGLKKNDLSKISIIEYKKLTIAGVLLFFLGYAIFFFNNNVAFSALGMENRVAIAATMGVSISVVGSLGWFGKIKLNNQTFKLYFVSAITILCTSGFLVINKTAEKWAEAYIQEQRILTQIKNNFPLLNHNSTFILDGICPYNGPAVVFDSNWDLSGALQLMYQDQTIKADIVTPKMQLTKNGLTTQLYHSIAKYPYTSMIVYNYKTNTSHDISSFGDADLYFKNKKYDFNNGCSASQSDPPNIPFEIKEKLLKFFRIHQIKN